MKAFDEMKEGKLKKIMENKTAMEKLSKSPEVLELMNLIREKSGGDLEAIAQSALKGDTAGLEKLVGDLGSSAKGAKLMEDVKGQMKP